MLVYLRGHQASLLAHGSVQCDFVPPLHARVAPTGLSEGRKASGKRAEEAARLGRGRRAQAGDEQGCLNGGGPLDD